MNKPIIWSYWNHEPIYHLKRMGNDGGTVFSLGEWVDEWYDRIHGEELIKKGAELGINTVYTHYYKGSGIQFEYEEMERTREFTETAHKYGIKVLGYMSMGSIYTENITREIPDVKSMLVIGRQGKPRPTLGNQYYRPRPCYNNDRYLEHLKSVIKYGIEHVGLDGFHFDNSTNVYCYCENCQRKFRQYLKDNFKNPYEVMGIKHFDDVQIPYYEVTNEPWDIHAICPTGNMHDVLFMWYHRFLRHSLKEFHTSCFDYVKEVSGGKALVLHNPGFPKDGYRDSRLKGYDPIDSPKSCDFAFVENEGGYFGKIGGRVEGQTMAYKYGERFGYKVFDTSWARSPKAKYSFPKDKAQIKGFVMQAAIYGGIAGVPWTVRSMKNGAEVAIDTPYLNDGLKESFGYFKDNYEMFNTKSYNHVKIVHIPDNIFCSARGRDDFNDVAKTLTGKGIPYSIITEDEIVNVAAGDTIVLPNIVYCGNQCYDNLKTAALNGARVVAVGGFGHYNDNTKGRCESNEIYDLKGIEGSLVVSLDKLGESIPKKLRVSEQDILLETRKTEDGRIVLYALNADPDRNLPYVEVEYEDAELLKCSKCETFTPDDSVVEAELINGKAIIRIKAYETLAGVVFS